MEKSILTRIVSSIPIVGTALAMWIEYTEIGVEHYGTLLGLLRGLVVGFGVAVIVIGSSEAAIAIFDVGRFWVEVHVTSHYKMEIGTEASRQAADELNHPHKEQERKRLAPTATKEKSDCPARGPIMPCFWLSGALGEHGKLHYILGVSDAVSSDHDQVDQLFRKDWNFREHIQHIDKFYANGAHADIPVIDALREVGGR